MLLRAGLWGLPAHGGEKVGKRLQRVGGSIGESHVPIGPEVQPGWESGGSGVSRREGPSSHIRTGNKSLVSGARRLGLGSPGCQVPDGLEGVWVLLGAGARDLGPLCSEGPPGGQQVWVTLRREGALPSGGVQTSGQRVPVQVRPLLRLPLGSGGRPVGLSAPRGAPKEREPWAPAPSPAGHRDHRPGPLRAL